MNLANITPWSAISGTLWSYWSSTLWKDIGFVYDSFGGGAYFDPNQDVNKVSKRTKEAVLRLKFYFEGYPPVEIEKKIKKSKKITVEDVKFVKNQIFIRDIKL